MPVSNAHIVPRYAIVILFLIAIAACKKPSFNTVTKAAKIEQKVDSLLQIMTLEEKIGQMTQVRHFYDIKDNDIADKFIGSVINTQGPLPGADAAGWQERFRTLQDKALSTRLGIPLLFGVDAVHAHGDDLFL